MRHRLSILYAWFVKLVTSFLPNAPVFMRFRGWLYSFMMKKCGKDFQVTSSTYINSLSGLEVGNHVYIAHNTVIIGTKIVIEDEVLIGPNCVISGGNHTFTGASFRFGASNPLGIVIRHGSWIAGNCSILGGAVLPEQSILAAGSVLNKEFEKSKTLYAGVPATEIKDL